MSGTVESDNPESQSGKRISMRNPVVAGLVGAALGAGGMFMIKPTAHPVYMSYPQVTYVNQWPNSTNIPTAGVQPQPTVIPSIGTERQGGTVIKTNDQKMQEGLSLWELVKRSTGDHNNAHINVLTHDPVIINIIWEKGIAMVSPQGDPRWLRGEVIPGDVIDVISDRDAELFGGNKSQGSTSVPACSTNTSVTANSVNCTAPATYTIAPPESNNKQPIAPPEKPIAPPMPSTRPTEQPKPPANNFVEPAKTSR